MSGSTANIIVYQVKLVMWVGKPKVVDPYATVHKGDREMNIWLIAWIYPVVDGYAGWINTDGAVDNWARLIINLGRIDHVNRGDIEMGVRNVNRGSMTIL